MKNNTQQTQDIPTAEFILEAIEAAGKDKEAALSYIRSYGKVHAKQALQAAAENAIAKENPADYGTGEIWVDKKSILNAYPESNIK